MCVNLYAYIYISIFSIDVLLVNKFHFSKFTDIYLQRVRINAPHKRFVLILLICDFWSNKTKFRLADAVCSQ